MKYLFFIEYCAIRSQMSIYTVKDLKYSFDLFVINRKKNKNLIAVIGKMNSAFLNLHVINFEV